MPSRISPRARVAQEGETRRPSRLRLSLIPHCCNWRLKSICFLLSMLSLFLNPMDYNLLPLLSIHRLRNFRPGIVIASFSNLLSILILVTLVGNTLTMYPSLNFMFSSIHCHFLIYPPVHRTNFGFDVESSLFLPIGFLSF